MPCRQAISALLALAGAAVGARADLLWDNGGWDRLGNYSSERNTLIPESWVVDDFTVNEPIVLREYRWYCAVTTDLNAVGSDLIVLDDSLEPVAELFDLAYSRRYDGEYLNSLDVYEVTLAGLFLQLAPGHYYIGGRLVGDGVGRHVAGLQRQVYGETEPYFRSDHFGHPDWTPLGQIYASRDASFKVYGDIVPAPATLALAALAPLSLRRRR